MYQDRLSRYVTIAAILVAACHGPSERHGKNAPIRASNGSFQDDQRFLQQHDSSLVVLQQGNARILLSPKYQGKVFTSTVGDNGVSFGWIHYKAFDGPLDPHMNGYGGENRLWLGPEGGPYSLFFPKDAKMEFANWKTPAPFDSESWELVAESDTSATVLKHMELVNYTGAQLSLSITRQIHLLSISEIDSLLGLSPDTDVQVVGYSTRNTLTNNGSTAWTGQTGMPCIWMLDMFRPGPATTIVIPYKDVPKGVAPATTDYFGKIPPDRVRFAQGTLYFKADGKARGKLGIHPPQAKNIAGSYDAEHQVLTIISFDIDSTGQYLNQQWTTTEPPFTGDAMNAYNDGPLADGSQLGPFYEMESVSVAAHLDPNQSLTHTHRVFHFIGSSEGLDRIAKRLLGVSLARIRQGI